MNKSIFQGRLSPGCIMIVALSLNTVFAATDRWTNSLSGFWRVGGGNWSLGVPPGSADSAFFTNATSKTISVDGITPLTNLTVSRLSISAPTGSTNTLRVVDLTTNVALHVTSTLTVDSRAVMLITNSVLQADTTFDVTGGALTLDSGLINSSNITVNVGRLSSVVGTLNLNGGTMLVSQLSVGSRASGQQNARGVVNISGGTLNSSSQMLLGNGINSTGIVSMTSGQLIATNSISGVGIYSVKVGVNGPGQMTIAGGSATFTSLSVGNNASGIVNVSGGQVNIVPGTTNDYFEVGNLGAGQFTLSGGTMFIGGEMNIAGNAGNPPFSPPGPGDMLVSGGQLIATNDIAAIGKYYQGTLTITNATVTLTNASVGRHDGATGILTVQSNGTLYALDDLSIARFSNSVGLVTLTGGLLSLAKDNIWAGRGGSGQMVVSNGTVQCRSLFVAMAAIDPETLATNIPSGSFTLAGGNVIVASNMVVGTPNLSTGLVSILGGSLTIADGAGGAPIAVNSGTFTLNQGIVTADKVLVTNKSAQLVFSGGTLQTKSMSISNGTTFVVGNGVNPATLQLQGGTYSFADGLLISSNATVTGCGTIIGAITNNGTLSTNCGGGITITAIAQNGNTSTVYFTTTTGANYHLQYNTNLADTNWTDIPPGIAGNGGVMSQADASATNDARFYRVRMQ
jgi:hypothetical protein